MTRRRAALVVLGLLAAALLLTVDPPAPSPDAWLAADGLAAERFEAGATTLRYVRLGRGPRLVLVHGIASSIYTWRELLGPLAADHEVAALDLPGFGGSEPRADLRWEELPASVLALLDHLGWERATLVGHSLGGAVVTVVASTQPARVESLVLLNSAGFNLAPEDRPALLGAVGHPLLAPLVERWPWRRPLVRLGLTQVMHDDALVTDERVEAYRAPYARPGATRALRALLSSSANLPFDAVARAVVAPTLVVWGRQDGWIPVSDADRFVAAIPGARLELLDACGHMPQEERPRELLALLRDFAPGAPG